MTDGELKDRIEAVRARIERAGGDADKVRLIAITKGFGPETVEDAFAAGLSDLGESYVQELTEKAQAAPAARWHFVGRLQRNKVRKAAGYVTLWHSVDRLSLGAEIARRAPGAAVLVQVNLTGEPTKAGCSVDELPGLVDGLREQGLDVRGLMTIGPMGPAESARPAFAGLTRLADGLGLPERSMGMSRDLEVAVEEGATMVRVGSALFGPRPGGAGVRH